MHSMHPIADTSASMGIACLCMVFIFDLLHSVIFKILWCEMLIFFYLVFLFQINVDVDRLVYLALIVLADNGAGGA